MKTRTFTIGLVVAALAVALMPSAAEAGHKRKHRHGHGHAVVRSHGHAHGHDFVAVRPLVPPRRLVVSTASPLRPYYARSVWFAPHRHRHAVYAFPVMTAYGVVTRPFVYCDGVLVPPRGYVAHGDRWDGRYGYRADFERGYTDMDDGVAGYVEFNTPRVRFGIGF